MWFSRRAVGLHALIIVVVPTFAALCVWQLRRALGGNDLSWAYVFEWPFFAGYAVYMWWRFIHETPLDTTATPTPAPPASTDADADANTMTEDSGGTDDEAAERSAYNTYLAELAARDKPKQWH